MVSACNQQKSKMQEPTTEKELRDWYSEGEWNQGWDARPDESVNQKEFARLYFQNPERWDKAFQFLSEQNLAELEKGRYELEGADLFVNIDEYVTRNEEKVLFEAHKKYADNRFDFRRRKNTGFTIKKHNYCQALLLAAGLKGMQW